MDNDIISVSHKALRSALIGFGNAPWCNPEAVDEAIGVLIYATPERACQFVSASPDPTLHLHDGLMYVGECNGRLQEKPRRVTDGLCKNCGMTIIEQYNHWVHVKHRRLALRVVRRIRGVREQREFLKKVSVQRELADRLERLHMLHYARRCAEAGVQPWGLIIRPAEPRLVESSEAKP